MSRLWGTGLVETPVRASNAAAALKLKLANPTERKYKVTGGLRCKSCIGTPHPSQQSIQAVFQSFGIPAGRVVVNKGRGNHKAVCRLEMIADATHEPFCDDCKGQIWR